VTDAAAPELIRALRRNGVADTDGSALAQAMYSSDASLYRVVPQAVARPRDSDELLGVIETARELGVPLTMRGAGTSIAGNAVGPGIVVDTIRHLNRVLSTDPQRRTATVQPGCVHATLQRTAGENGLRFGPDPSTHTRCTVGGMIGNNACGARTLGYGRTSDNVVDLTVATADGSVWQTSSPDRVVGDRLVEVADMNLGTIRTEFGRFGRQVSGYALEHLLPERGRDVTRLLVGSEGTLAVVLEATVRLVEDASCRALAVLGFATIADAADAAPVLVGNGPVACEGLDHRIVEVVRQRRGDAAVPPLPQGGAWLLVETTGETQQEAAASAAGVADLVDVPRRVVADRAEQADLWRIREDGAGLGARSLARPAHAGWEDAAVPPARLGSYLRAFESLLAEHGLATVPYGHFGDGCVHARIDFPLAEPGGPAAFRRFLGEAADLVAAYDGTLSGEHGDGRARSQLLPAMYSTDALDAFAQVKRIFDPDGLLNPGVLVDPAPVDSDVRLFQTLRPPPIKLRLTHDNGSLVEAVHRCTGVGRCVAPEGTGKVMCPSYIATREEKDSTRGRARVLQEMVNGSVVGEGWHSPEVHAALDLCLACKGCASDCPTGVDMATYKAEALYHRYRHRIRPRSHYALGLLPTWARLAQPAAPLANRFAQSPQIGKLAKAAAGVDQRRNLPLLSTTPFRRWARSRARDDRPDVVVWADSFTDSFAAEAGQAAVALLRSAGQRVHVTTEAACCGLTRVATGQLDAARRQLERTLRVLRPYVAAGIPVVGLEPSCLATLRSDAVELTADPRAAEVASGVRTLAEHLATLDDWSSPDLSGRTLVVQPHCHHASVLGWARDAALLSATGAAVRTLDGCCGLAGSFGVERGHYEVSVAVAEHALLPAVRAADHDAVLVADGFSCRTQIADLTGRRAVHLAELLHAASS
jgi:FAD/FMN-containing dehydrogenase/Fe-S oxidoreductase